MSRDLDNFLDKDQYAKLSNTKIKLYCPSIKQAQHDQSHFPVSIFIQMSKLIDQPQLNKFMSQ